MKKICKYCEVEYETREKVQKYCSERCFGDAKAIKTIKIERHCLACGKVFLKKPSEIAKWGGKYCSIACRSSDKDQSGANNPMWKGGRIIRQCGICGRTFLRWPNQVTRSGGKYCSTKCSGIARTGDNHYNWKGGVTPENHRLRSSQEYLNWRNAIYARDNWTCQDCGDNKGGNLHAHHIFSFADFPEHRFKSWNGVTLCKTCHQLTHAKQVAV